MKPFSKKELYYIIPLSCLSTFIVIGTPFIVIEDLFLKIALIGYGIIISTMLAKALCNYHTHRSISFLFIVIGSILFYFSDIMLAIDMFGSSSRLVWILCSYSYWPTQTLLAHSLYYLSK